MPTKTIDAPCWYKRGIIEANDYDKKLARVLRKPKSDPEIVPSCESMENAIETMRAIFPEDVEKPTWHLPKGSGEAYWSEGQQMLIFVNEREHTAELWHKGFAKKTVAVTSQEDSKAANDAQD